MAVVQKLRCRVARVVDHGDHVYTVDLRPERPAPKFLPGQFLHLALDEYDPSAFWPESRVFSIASSPTRRESLRISYSVRGRFTARMEEELREGAGVWVKLPYGEFVIQDRSDVVLFAGGTGITAFTSFLEGLTAQFRHRVVLAYGARRRNLLLYRDLVEEKRRTLPGFQRVYFVEEETSGREIPGAGEEEGERKGKVALDSLWGEIVDPRQAVFYLSGPPAMLRALTRDLLQRGISPDSIQTDAWE